MRKTCSNISFLLLLVICFLINTSFAKKPTSPPPRKTLAVYELKGYQVTDVLAKTLTERLRDEIFQRDLYRLVTRSEMTEVLTEQGFQLTGACDDASCLVEIGRLIGAEFIVGGSVSQVDNKYSVAISIVNVATGEVVNSNSISGFLNTDKLLGQGAVKLIDGLLQKRARRGILQSPYFWSGIAVTVAAGTYVYLQSQEEQPEVPITTGTVEVTVIFP